ncbi:MAG: methyltransferase domain-containing protein [Ktedonobacteraceae bacterium]|nr:methyltransferase domain-containing protein [Ktedonobacteraceae bacterium]
MAVQPDCNKLPALYEQAPPATPLLDINFGFARARALDTALNLDLFTALAGGANTCATLAVATGSDSDGLQLLLDALVALELLMCRDGIYSLSYLAASYLVKEQPGYIGAHLMAVMEQWNTWSELTRVMREGRKKRSGHIPDLGAPGARSRNAGMFAEQFPLVFPGAWQAACQFDQPLCGCMLDLFAGSGAWGIAFALCHPQIHVVVRDEAALLEMLRERIAQSGLEERFTLQAIENEENCRSSERFDLIALGNVCRFIGARRSQALLRECYQRLQPGGKLLLADVMRNEARTGPPAALIIGLSLFINTQEGEVFTAAQYRAWLKAAGFEQIHDLKTGQGPLLLASR